MKLSYKQIAVSIFCPLVILSLLFLWREFDDLSLYKKINHEKLADFFTSLFTLYGTIAAIYFAYNQNRLAEENNVSIIRPYLVPQTSSFKMDDFPYPLELNAYEKLHLTFPKAVSEEARLGLKIKNKGVGAAKDISIVWKFDKQEIDKIVEGVYHPTDTNRSTIPEVIQTEETEYLPLPNYYLTCCGPLMNKGVSIITNIPILPPDLELHVNSDFIGRINRLQPNLKPPISLIVNYSDMHGRKYSKAYKVSLDSTFDRLTFEFEPKV